MEQDPSLESLNGLFRDGASVYFSMVLLALFCTITLVGIQDQELFTLSRRVGLPIVGSEMSIRTFFWVLPAAISVLSVYFILLTVRVGQITAQLGSSLSLAADRAPLFIKWSIYGRTREDYGLSVSSAFLIQFLTLCYVWWRSHAYHDLQLSLLIAFFIAVVPASAMAANSLLQREPRRPSRRVMSIQSLCWAALVVLLAAMTVLRTTSLDARLVARADLQSSEIVLRPRDYVPRFIWVSEYLRDHPLSNGQTPPTENGIRREVERDWYRRREYYLQYFSGRDLSNVDLRHADMTDSFLPGVVLSGGVFDQAKMTRANLEAVAGTNVSFDGAALDGAHLEESWFRKANFSRARMNNAGLEEAHLECSSFSGTNLFKAQLDGVFLDSADLSNADLRGASLRGAYIKLSNFSGADLTGADLTGAILWSSNLSGAKGLKQEQLAHALGDVDTRLSGELSIRTCWDNIPQQSYPYRLQWWLRETAVRNRILCATEESVPLPETKCQ